MVKIFHKINNATIVGFRYNKLYVQLDHGSNCWLDIAMSADKSYADLKGPYDGKYLKLTIPKSQMRRYSNVSIKEHYSFDVVIDQYTFKNKSGWYCMVNGIAPAVYQNVEDDSGDDSDDLEPTKIRTKPPTPPDSDDDNEPDDQDE